MAELEVLLTNIINALTIIGVSYVALAILITGFIVIFGGREGIQLLKKYSVTIISGAVLIFGASGLALAIRALIPW